MIRFYTEIAYARIYMDVNIDQARGHNMTRGIEDLTG
jgi:hypothetical protein